MEFDANGTPSFEKNAGGSCPCHHRKVWPAQMLAQVGLGSTHALAILLCDLVKADTLLFGGIKVAALAESGSDSGLHEQARNRIG
jgi:hypothetical protein